jgi:hypothetical protein
LPKPVTFAGYLLFIEAVITLVAVVMALLLNLGPNCGASAHLAPCQPSERNTLLALTAGVGGLWMVTGLGILRLRSWARLILWTLTVLMLFSVFGTSLRTSSTYISLALVLVPGVLVALPDSSRAFATSRNAAKEAKEAKEDKASNKGNRPQSKGRPKGRSQGRRR